VESSGCPPIRIIFFRDGLSDSQFEDIGAREIAVIDSALEGNADRVVLTAPGSRRYSPESWTLDVSEIESPTCHICCSWEEVCCINHFAVEYVLKQKSHCRHHIRFFPIDGR
jgi:hypothetical protein